ncbi:MAG: hypothetical protein LBH95_00195 [Oscillospiraceae bacterium]|jgi:cell division protein FtsB|nr:hypothetical protein [Oscillospiraceae bacterium]
MEQRGIRTERGDMNREIEITNKEIKQLRARINHLNKWIAEESANAKPPTLADVIDEILSRQGQSGLARLKNAAEVFAFLQRNEIYSMEDLEKKVSTMRGKFHSVSEDLKKVNRRIDTLKEHIKHSENYKEHRTVKRQYDKLYSEYTAARKETGFFAERKAQKALDAANNFYDTFSAELILFDAAEKYLRGVLQGRFDPKKLPPITMWRQELGTKTSEKNVLNREYTLLKEETAKVEKIKRSVMEILHSDELVQTTERTTKRPYGMEL